MQLLNVHRFECFRQVRYFLILSLATLFLGACKDRAPTLPEGEKQKKNEERSSPSFTAEERGDTDSAAPLLTTQFTFLAYNLQNYLKTPLYRERKIVGERYKAAEQIGALVSVVKAANPDLLGICEIGTTEDLAHFQRELSEVGLHYPHSEHVASFDPTRHLALLSRYPITNRQSQRELSYEIGTLSYPLKRGILDVTVDIDGFALQLVGVHLKSKRPSRYQDQAKMRLREAVLLRAHLDTIFTSAQQKAVLLYGDFNDTYRSAPLSIIKGKTHSKRAVTVLNLQDQSGHYWTHFWKEQRTYSTFDYVLVSRGLKPYFRDEQSTILEGEAVELASDHRPLLVTFGEK